MSFYIDYFLEHNKQPTSVYLFAKHYTFDESLFYKNYASFDLIEKDFFNSLFINTKTLLHKSDEFSTYDARTQLLSFYFTYFEMLSANRSFVVAQLKENSNKLKSLSKLSELRIHFKSFYNDLEIEKIANLMVHDDISLDEQDVAKLEKYKDQIKIDCDLNDEEAMKLVYETLVYRKLKSSDSSDMLEKGTDFGAGFS